MSLDVRARDAGLAARQASARGIDATAGLEDLKRRHHRRVVTARTATVTVLLAIMIGLGLFVRADTTSTPPIDTPRTLPHCTAEVCTGSGPYEVELPTNLTWTVPEGYEQHRSGTTVAARPTAEAGRSPLVVLEDVRGGDYRSQARDRGTPSDLATWMTAAPELGASSIQQTTLAGLPALRLTVRPTTGFLLFGTSAPIPEPDQLDPAWFPAGGSFDIGGYLQRTWAYVATPGQATDVWLVDAPGGRVTAIVRPVSTDPTTVAATDALLGSLRFVP